MNSNVMSKTERCKMIKSIVEMHSFILSMILASWHVLPPTLSTPGMDGHSQLSMAGDMAAAGMLIGSYW